MNKRANWREFQSILDKYHISTLYHFTDRKNLESIILNRGLYSWADCELMDIQVKKPGGGDISRALDKRAGLEHYVRVSFTREHPMMYVARSEGRILDPVVLEISPEVIFLNTTKYADSNATRNDAHIGDELSDFKRIHFNTIKVRKHFDVEEGERSYFQAEVLVKGHIPLNYITNLRALVPPNVYNSLCIDVSEEDLKNAITDEHGVKYSPDGLRVLKLTKDISEYAVKPGTKVICNAAFQPYGNRSVNSLKKIVLPDSIEIVGRIAFANNENLESINIPRNIKRLALNNPFGGCTNLKYINIQTDAIVRKGNLILDKNHKALYSCLFNNVTSVRIPEQVKYIAANAFWCQRTIQAISIPKNTVFIGHKAFFECSALRYLVIPISTRHIDSNPFCGCKCRILNASPYFVENEGILYTSDKSELINCFIDAPKIEIAEEVKLIRRGAFLNRYNLKEILLPNNLIEIGDYAFANCISLNRIHIPDNNMITISGDTFDNTFLREIEIPQKYEGYYQKVLPKYSQRFLIYEQIDKDKW